MNRAGFLKAAAAAIAAPYIAKLEHATAVLERLGPPATTLQVTGGGWAELGDIVRVASTGEAMMVTAIDAGSWTVTRGIGSIRPQAVRRGEGLLLLAGMASEGADISPYRGPKLARVA